MATRGALLVFEGAEGVGKTTQIRLLSAQLTARGIRVLTVREPGGTPAGDEIRRLLLDPAQHVTPRAEALLFLASRAQLVEDVVRPAVNAGTLVIADRFFLSTYAYQVAGRGLDELAIRQANAIATGGLVPDLTVLLDLPVEEGMRRAVTRGAQDRMERSGDAFLARVAEAFRVYATPGWQGMHPECGPLVRVDASGSEMEVAAAVGDTVRRALQQTLGALAASNR